MLSATSQDTENNAISKWVSFNDKLSEGPISRSIKLT